MKRPVRRKRSSWSRLRPFWIVGVIVAGLAVWGAFAFAGSPKFHLAQLTVTGTHRASQNDVVAKAAIGPRENIWLLDVRAVEARVATVPYVKAAHVHRTFPAGVRIDVDEREPVACVRYASGGDVTVDAENRVVQAECLDGLVVYALHANEAAPAGAFVRDAELSELQDDARSLAPSAQRFVSFAHDRYDQLVATLAGGVVVQFGDDDELGRKERLVGPILAELGPRAGRVASLDIRTPATPVVEYRPQAPAMHRPPQAVDRQ